MKNSIFRSFRFEITMYSLLSLLYTILTEAALFFSIYLIYHILVNDKEVNNNILNASENGIPLNEYAINGTLNKAVSQGPAPLSKGLIIAIIIISVILAVALFITYFLVLTKKFAIYLEEIAGGITEISTGNFNSRIEIRSKNEFTLIATKVNQMANDIKQLIENNRKNESTKNELITSVAHDLRTPLTSIIGYLDLVSEESKLTDDMKQRYIEIAYSKSKRLEKLIEDLFAYTKFSFGEVTMEKSEIDMVKFINQLADEFYPSFQDSGLQYDFSTKWLSAVVVADGNLLARAFANLISNAIKYGRDGKRVKIRLMKEQGNVIVSVTNYGKLIPEKDLQNIFDRFYRVETSRSSETGGTGLGLAIAKSIILMHGGSIKVRSDFEGTVFEVALEAKKEVNMI